MNGVKQQPWWRRSLTISPTAATFIGILVGSALGGLAAFPWFDRLSFVLWLYLASLGGVSGYIAWLTSDRARQERFQKMVGLLALVVIAVLLFAFPDLWRLASRSGVWTGILLGGNCAASMCVVGAGWGVIQLVGYLSSRLRRDAKASMDYSSEGVWDRELDHAIPAVKRES